MEPRTASKMFLVSVSADSSKKSATLKLKSGSLFRPFRTESALASSTPSRRASSPSANPDAGFREASEPGLASSSTWIDQPAWLYSAAVPSTGLGWATLMVGLVVPSKDRLVSKLGPMGGGVNTNGEVDVRNLVSSAVLAALRSGRGVDAWENAWDDRGGRAPERICTSCISSSSSGSVGRLRGVLKVLRRSSTMSPSSTSYSLSTAAISASLLVAAAFKSLTMCSLYVSTSVGSGESAPRRSLSSTSSIMFPFEAALARFFSKYRRLSRSMFVTLSVYPTLSSS
mmetsp:Transcript_12812/g.47356  ORF Transcript_12812/g.47356 Transcript_12812/m.47356 type:complete len:285 (-) Transcript_12812:834-1688(-)